MQVQLSPGAIAALNRAGISDVQDLANFAVTPADLIELSTDPVVLTSITKAWEAACVQARVAEQGVAKFTALKRPLESAVKHGGCLNLGVRPKARLFAPAMLQPRSFRAAITLAQAPAGRKPAGDKRQQCLDTMFEVAVQCGSGNVAFGRDLVLQQEEARPSFERKFHTQDVSKLSAMRAALRRCVQWHKVHAPVDQPFWKPTAVSLSAYLDHGSAGGPTAAPGAFAALKWWREHVGVPFPVQDGLVSHWSCPTQGYVPKQREPLPLCIMLALCHAGRRSTGAIRTFICHALLALVACLRFRHLQRSADLRRYACFLRATCRKGKRRVKNTQPPFDWACPAILPGALNLADQVLLDYGELQRAMGDNLDFLINDYAAPRGDALQSASKVKLRPMELPRFSAALLAAPSPTRTDMDKFSAYSLRRFLPTAADILRLPEEMRLAIGSWQDHPKSRSEVDTRSAARTMAQHYSRDKVLTAQVKLEVIVSIDMVATRASPQLTWHDLRMHAPSQADLEKQLRTGPWSTMPVTHETKTTARQATVSSSASSSSSSSTDDDGELLQWFQQASKGACHIIQGMSGTRLVPFCQDLAFDTPHVARGAGIEPPLKVCKKCWGRAPQRLRELCPAVP